MNLLKSFSWLVLAEAVGRVGAIFTVIYLARVQGTERLGQLGAAFAAVSFVQLFVAGAMGSRGLRDLLTAQANPAQVVTLNVITQLLLYGVALVLVLLVGAGLPLTRDQVLLLAVYMLLPLCRIAGANWVLRARNDLAPNAVAEALSWGVYAALLVATVHADTPVHWVAACHVLGCSVSVPVTLWRAMRGGPLWGELPTVAQVLALLRSGLQISVGGLRRLVFAQFDVLLLAAVVGTIAAGEFLASHRMVLTLLIPGDVLRAAVLPQVLRWSGSRPRAAARKQWRMLRVEWLLIVPACLAISLSARDIIHLVYGPGHADAAGILRWMLPLVVLMGPTQMLQGMLLSRGRDAAQGMAAAATIMVHVVLSVLLTLQWGLMGVVAASWLSLLFGIVAGWFLLRDVGIGAPMLRQLLKVPLAAGLVLLADAAVDNPSVVLHLLLGLSLYFALLVVFGGVSRADWRSVRQAI